MTQVLLSGLLLFASPAMAQQVTLADKDGYAMGPGTWTCDKAVAVAMSDGGQDKSALIGWILGAWSLSTFIRAPAFSDTIEQVGGQQIYIETIRQCEAAPADELLHLVVRAMIDNTGSD
ncbi:5'-methylthioadenosine phosphorylase [Roseivivax sp. CAU 1753]